MSQLANLSILMIAMTNLVLLGTSRLGLCVRVVALQGAALALFTLLDNAANLSVHLVLVALATLVLKAFVFPRLLFNVLHQTDVRREMEPYVGYTSSIMLGMALLLLSRGVSRQLPLDNAALPPLVLPIALWTIFVGLFLVMARRKAISQVLGYLVIENGIFAFGAALAGEMSLLVELGCLLDVFMAVFVMGLAIFHINKEFDHMDTDRLTALRD